MQSANIDKLTRIINLEDVNSFPLSRPIQPKPYMAVAWIDTQPLWFWAYVGESSLTRQLSAYNFRSTICDLGCKGMVWWGWGGRATSFTLMIPVSWSGENNSISSMRTEDWGDLSSGSGRCNGGCLDIRWRRCVRLLSLVYVIMYTIRIRIYRDLIERIVSIYT